MKNEVVKKIISSLPATVPLAILQADHVGKIMSEESQPDCRQWRRMQNPTFYFNDLARFFPPVFPLKSVMAKQNLQSWSLDIRPPSLQNAAFSYSTFPFN